MLNKLNPHIVSRARNGLVELWLDAGLEKWAIRLVQVQILIFAGETSNFYLTYWRPMGVKGNKAFYSGINEGVSGASLNCGSF